MFTKAARLYIKFLLSKNLFVYYLYSITNVKVTALISFSVLFLLLSKQFVLPSDSFCKSQCFCTIHTCWLTDHLQCTDLNVYVLTGCPYMCLLTLSLLLHLHAPLGTPLLLPSVLMFARQSPSLLFMWPLHSPSDGGRYGWKYKWPLKNPDIELF